MFSRSAQQKQSATIASTVQKIKFFIKDLFSKCDQMQSHLLKKSLLENFTFCAVCIHCSYSLSLRGAAIKKTGLDWKLN